MSLILEKTIKATWECDWCFCEVITDSEHMPEGWEEANEPCGGAHFCSYDHYYLSQCAWEDGFDEAMDAQDEAHERIRLEWTQKHDGTIQ